MTDVRFDWMTTQELVRLLILTAKANEPEDKQFIVELRDYIKARKPETK